MGLSRFLPLLALLAAALAGCGTKMQTPYQSLALGEFDDARLEMRDKLTDDRGDRRYLLDRMRLGALTLADGYPQSAQTVYEQVYDVLRTQGINADKTVDAVVLHEGVRLWKGEPFEQALAMAYYGMAQAELGSWDNARAAANNALFNLRDFGEDRGGRRLDSYAIARQSLRYERARARGASESEARAAADYLDHGYVVRDSNFTLGYLLNGIANQQLGRAEEASDNFNRVAELDPALDALMQTFQLGEYNTVLVVSYGLGPRKEAYGPDGALARFRARMRSDGAPLIVRVDEHGRRTYPQVLDVNTMAADHMWRNLEDIRIAKSIVGTGLLHGGAIAAHVGARHDSDAAVLAGLGAMAAGVLVKAGARADTRYCDVYPQRFYVVPLNVSDRGQRIELQVEGVPGSRLVLAGLDAPTGAAAQLRYVRLLHTPGGAAPAWARSGEVFYGNPRTGAAPGPQRPYILGGDCVRPPTQRLLEAYRAWGYLRNNTLAELRDLYRAERIVFDPEDQGGYAGRHVLEGGRSLVAPLAGTTGFARLFGQRHGRYEPRSRAVAEAMREAERVRAGVMTQR
ncbi:MAG: hypothetical protein ACODAQ_10045 [Phycisphaeraceae bacterium]